jgi:hypothetical protein
MVRSSNALAVAKLKRTMAELSGTPNAAASQNLDEREAEQ